MQINNILKKSGWYILSVLSLVPLVLWFFAYPIGSRFANLPMLAISLGDIFGLCGMAMFALVLILSARFIFFEKFFNGMNEVYTAHHVFGGLSLILLLFHPLLLLYNYISVSVFAGALFLLPSWGSTLAMAKTFGIIGLFVMIVTLVITFYTKLKYQVWKFTHKFLGVAFVFAFFHIILTGGDISSNYPLKAYLVILSVLAISTYIYRTLLGRYLVRTFKYKVTRIKSSPDKIWEIEFLLAGKKEIRFKAGQFVFLKMYKSYLQRESHPFTISSAPGAPLRIAVKELGDYTNKISGLREGDLALLEGPFGAFDFRKYSNKKQIWIGGGIGITPFLSMARSLTAKDSNYQIDLYYSMRDGECCAFTQELADIAEKNKNLKVVFWVSRENGLLTGNLIKTQIKDFSERDILICGPGLMTRALKKQLVDQGIKRAQIHTEEFQMY